MRFMVIVKANADSEAGVMPSGEFIEQMGAYNNELIAAGVMLDGAGLLSSSNGARVSFDGDSRAVTQGPFAPIGDVVSGYWIWQCKDLQDAIAWLKKAPFRDGTLEIRPFVEPEAFEGIASDEIVQQEKAWREEQAKAAARASA